MDILVIALIVLAILSLGSWGYGTYVVRPAPGGGEVVAGPAPWVNPIGVIGLLIVAAVVILWLTGTWQPFGVAVP